MVGSGLAVRRTPLVAERGARLAACVTSLNLARACGLRHRGGRYSFI
jgi:hypothetical protein